MTALPRRTVFLALLALLAITRVGHFGSTVSLPDASLAVFMLGGLWLGTARPYAWAGFAAYAATAFGIDVYLARHAVEAGWCLTPAYGGLVASYGVMWLAGRWLAQGGHVSPARLAGAGLLAVVAAFFVSNLSFWAFSGYFGSMAGSEYAARVLQYLPPYLGSTALYLALAWIAQALVAGLSTPRRA